MSTRLLLESAKNLKLRAWHRTDQDLCFPKHIGYQPASIMAKIDGKTYFHVIAQSYAADNFL